MGLGAPHRGGSALALLGFGDGSEAGSQPGGSRGGPRRSQLLPLRPHLRQERRQRRALPGRQNLGFSVPLGPVPRQGSTWKRGLGKGLGAGGRGKGEIPEIPPQKTGFGGCGKGEIPKIPPEKWDLRAAGRGKSPKKSSWKRDLGKGLGSGGCGKGEIPKSPPKKTGFGGCGSGEKTGKVLKTLGKRSGKWLGRNQMDRTLKYVQ